MRSVRPATDVRPEDRVEGGYFTVQDLRGSGHPHDFNVRGYDRFGNLLLHTWHIGESSKDVECAAWRSRGATERPFSVTK
jgi:hypothetical protein